MPRHDVSSDEETEDSGNEIREEVPQPTRKNPPRQSVAKGKATVASSSS